MDEPLSDDSPAPALPQDRLESWKEIATYLNRDVTTVQRWEKREGMPVHRHLHDKIGSVYAFRAELDAWARSRQPAPRWTRRRPAASPHLRRLPVSARIAFSESDGRFACRGWRRWRW